MNKAEVGSVQYFRRLISMITVIIIAVLLVLLLFVSKNLKSVKADLEYYKSQSSVGAVNVEKTSMQDGEVFPYQTLYPDMYVEAPTERTKLYDAERFYYLTFTGGPSEETEKILDTLKKEKVKATFFVYGGDTPEGKAIIKRIVDEGHTVGVYGYELPQNQVYKDIDTYLEDFWKEFKLISEVTGEKPTVFKFQGGTTNKYNSIIRQQLSAEMIRRGFTYFDWNSNSGDNLSGETTESIINNAIQTGSEKQRIFLQMHDNSSCTSTAKALPEIIKHFKDAGYEFKAITNDIQPMAFE